MIVWQVAREYAHLAEAGGVKNVVCSLSEGLAKLNHNVTLFIPLYGCTDLSIVADFVIHKDFSINIPVAEKKFDVCFATGKINDISVVFIVSSCFTEKLGVYTYTVTEEEKNPQFVRGKGHIDAVEIEIMFQKAVVEYGKIAKIKPDVVHCHDATTALIPALANISEKKDFLQNSRFIVTVHNAGPAYHHEIENIEKAHKLTGIPKDILALGLVGEVVEPYLLASNFGKITTVSPWYANEITDPNNNDTQGLSKAFYDKKVQVFGITNGMDFEKYNPVYGEKSHLLFPYNPEKGDLEGKYKGRELFFNQFDITSLTEKKDLIEVDYSCISQHGYLESLDKETVVFSYHGRLVHQKGLEVFEKAIPLCIKQNPNIRFVITGQGDVRLEEQQIKLANQYPGKVLYLKGYHRALARLCVAISDFIVLPSFFEPCGLEDFIASIVGTIPLAHKTGGLQKIVDGETGFLYSPNNEEELCKNILSLVDFKNNQNSDFIMMIKNASKKVHYDYDWNNVINNYYILLYK